MIKRTSPSAAAAPTLDGSDKPLDLAVIIPELCKYGGAERLLIECVSRWQNRHKITIYAAKFSKALLREHGIGRQVNLYEISPNFEDEHSILLNAVLLPKIWEREIGVHDLYHTHLWPTHLIDLHPMVWYPHEPLRVLHDLRYEQPLDDFADMFQRSLHIYPKYNYDRISDVTYEAYLSSIDMFDKLGKPDRIVANSRYTAGYLEGVYNAKIDDVVYPGVSPEDFIFQPSNENIFLCIGQLWPHKRVKLIIEALRYVEDSQLYIVGSGPEKEKLLRTAAGMGVGDRVFFLHGLTNLEVQILFSRALAVVFMPVKEPFGIVALEAMAAGKPLIAAKEGGFIEAVDESCALLVPPRPGEIAEKMRYLRDNKDIAKKMGAAGLERVKAFSWDNTAKQLLEVIEETHADWTKAHRPPEARASRGQTLFGAQYYLWYGNGMGSRHWNDNPIGGAVTDMPNLGYYASSSGVTIEEHLKLCAQMGIDFLVANLHIDGNGADAYELASAESLFSVAERIKSPVKICFQICPYDCKREDLTTTAQMIRKIFSRRKSYLKLDGKPVLFVFWTGVQDGNKRWIQTLADATENYLKIACSLRLYPPADEKKKTFGLFDGWSLFSPLELAASGSWKRVWTQAYKHADAGAKGLRIVTVSPGYDDSHLADPNRENNPYRAIDRRNGKTYQEMTDFVLALDERPDIALISTFNEYHENTQIEPTRDHGSHYVDLTKHFIQSAKKRWK